MSEFYVLRDKVPVPANLMEWGRFFETPDRVVAQDEINGVRISTVFLGINHSFDPHGPPLLFETMIFGGKHDGYQDRCSTWAEAELMHTKAWDLVAGITAAAQ